jgi:hypothetical protein
VKIYDPKNPVIALHIPKTGGTSFSEVLREWFPENKLMLHYSVNGDLPVKYDLSGECCIYGHFNGARGFGVEDYYPEVTQFFGFFREPFDRFLSQYFFLCKQKNKFDYIDCKKYFEAWIKIRAEEQMNGLNSYSFMWQLPKKPGSLSVKDMLKKNFIFVGVIEREVESMACLSKILNRNPATMRHLNSTFRDAVELGEWRSYYENNFADEMEFYEEVTLINDDLIASFK